MQRVEQRLEFGEKKKSEVVKVQSITCTSEQRTKLLELADQLAQPELCHDERLSIAAQLLFLFNIFSVLQPLSEVAEASCDPLLS
jgi:hypothetical protein